MSKISKTDCQDIKNSRSQRWGLCRTFVKGCNLIILERSEGKEKERRRENNDPNSLVLGYITAFEK
jgi:hypothetical protein